MKARYEQESGAEFDEASDIAIRLKVLAGEIYNAHVNMQWLRTQMFAETAGGEYLDNIAAQRGLTRKQAVKAKGEVGFYIDEVTDHNIIVPVGTVIATDDAEPIRFVTTEEGEITAGNTLVCVYAEAEKAGTSGNIMKDKAVVPVSVSSEINTVRNYIAFTGGEDEETDNELRERIRKSYINQPNGTNKAFYEQLALSVDGIEKAGVVPRVRGSGTVDIYVCGSETAASEEAKAALQEIVSKERELNVDVQVLDASFKSFDLDVSVVAKSGYGEAEITEKCTQAFRDFIKGLPIGAKLYLSALGKCLLETGCIENYEFDIYMENTVISGSQCFQVGEISITVEL